MSVLPAHVYVYAPNVCLVSVEVPLTLELQKVVSYYVLGIELRSSIRTASILTH